eukprot:Skav221137  [mRNA]  locus=scaffold233:687899:688318:+ [translate_table: standard]
MIFFFWACQPEEQHGFRPHYRLEEHLTTANFVVDKLLTINAPIWIVSLDLSKAFDRVNWNKLWLALHDHGVSEHLIWVMRCLYWQQVGCVQGTTETNENFPINAGVRQGRVLSPRLFSAVLSMGDAKVAFHSRIGRCWY